MNRNPTHRGRTRWVGAAAAAMALAVVLMPGRGTRVAGEPARTITVCASGCDYRTIQAAASWAESGDTILIGAGRYTENIELRRSLVLEGAGEGETIVDGQAAGSTFSIMPDVHVTLARMTITGGSGTERTIDGLRGRWGGGIYNVSESLTLDYVTVSGNRVEPLGGTEFASAYGGGIFNARGRELVIKASRITGNSAELGGGIAMWMFGALTAEDTTIADNQAMVSGGGVLVAEGALLRRCTVSGNRAARYGGGIANWLTDLTLENTTIAENTAGLGGGGVDVDRATARVFNSTIAGNAASSEGGGILVHSASPSVTIVHSIVSGNDGGDCAGGIASDGYNLGGDGSCGFDAEGDQDNIDPRLGPLSGNGGLTHTVALQPGSPAVDAGQSNPNGCRDAAGEVLRVDQRGEPRPEDGDGDGTARCDIGAFELAPQPTATATPTASRTPTATSTPTATPPVTVTATTTATATNNTVVGRIHIPTALATHRLR